MEAHLAKDWSQLRRLMIDETSARKGHRYVTVVLDAESHDLLFMVEGRSAQAITEFLAAMPAHGAKAEAITEVVMDMSPAYIAGVQTHFPNARIVFDLFHIKKLAGEALDAVRKSLRKQGADLTGGLWALRGNEWTRSQEQLELRRKLARAYPILGRAIALREALQGVFGRWGPFFHPLVAGLGRPLPARTFPANSPRTLKEHFHGILAYLQTRLTECRHRSR